MASRSAKKSISEQAYIRLLKYLSTGPRAQPLMKAQGQVSHFS
jgi:hypothetical protein